MPWRCRNASVSFAPSVGRMRFMASSMMEAGAPARSATRARKLSSKSSSPRMERSVISAILSLTPYRAASSSMHSLAIRVLSMSKNAHLNEASERFAGTMTQSLSRSPLKSEFSSGVTFSCAMQSKRVRVSSRRTREPGSCSTRSLTVAASMRPETMRSKV